MRREGFELGVSRPEVIFKEVDGQRQEPFENVLLDVEDQHQGGVMEEMGRRKANLNNLFRTVRVEFVLSMLRRVVV